MNYLILIILVVVSQTASAEVNCKSDTSPVTLFQEGKGLSSFKIQDQDGLGTCYGNAATAGLKSLLPDHDLSYQHAAIVYSTSVANESFQKTGKYIDKSKDDMTFGGHVCRTINELKKKGGACPKQYSKLENYTLDPLVQSRGMQGLGSYFDRVNQIKRDPTKYGLLKDDIKKVAGQLVNIKTDQSQDCEENKRATNPTLRDGVADILGYEAGDSLITPTDPCASAKLTALRKLAGPRSSFKRDRFNFEPSMELMDRVDQIFSNDPALARSLEEGLKGKLDKESYTKLQKELGARVNNILNEMIPLSTWKGKCNSYVDKATNSTVSPLTGILWSSGEKLIEGVRKMKSRDCGILDPKALDTAMDAASITCHSGITAKEITEALLPLIELGTVVNDELIDALADKDASGGHQLKRLLMPECEDKENLVPLDDITCESRSFCDFSSTAKIEKYSFSGPKNACYTSDQAKKKLRTDALKQLDGGVAVPVTICSRFLNEKNYNGGFCQKPGSVMGRHGIHAITITGYRCLNGKLQYELTNSWGANYCPPAQEINGKIECGWENGKMSGRFWVQEDHLVENMTDYEMLKKGP